FNRTFYVAATPEEDGDDVRQAVGIPQIGTPYKGAVCRRHMVKESTRCRNPFTGMPGFLYEVDIEFDNDINPDDADGGSPTERRARGRWRTETTEEVLTQDVITGDPIRNAANYPILVGG